MRNLALCTNDRRNSNKTTDDEAVPTSLSSPAKLLALREVRELGHSRSSNDLRPIHEAALSDHGPSDTNTNGTAEGGNGKRTRPRMAKLRRRSTMEWTGASSQARQKRLEDVSASRMADVFFSIHVAGVQGRCVGGRGRAAQIAEPEQDPSMSARSSTRPWSVI